MKRFLIAFLIFGLADSVTAHNFERTTPDNSITWEIKRSNYMPIEHVNKIKIDATHRPPGLLYVVQLPNRWAQTQKINICFKGGTESLRKRIISIAEIWFKQANLKVDVESATKSCQNNDKSEIRIGFSEPGYWSYIGNDSLDDYLVSNDLASMNFEGFDKNPPSEPRFTGIVLHEFGHALALHHEHQSPASGCDTEYDWDKLYAYYKSTYNWEKSEVDQNVKQLLNDRTVFDWSELDPESIMIYSSNPDFLKKGKESPCYFHDNNKLSLLDNKGIRITYPTDNSKYALELQSVTLPIALKIETDNSLKKALSIQNNIVIKQMELQ